MLICMRTTLIIDDMLLRAAKKRAAEKGRTLSALVAEALRDSLRSVAPPPARPFRMLTFGGGRRVHHEPADFARALEDDDRRQRR